MPDPRPAGPDHPSFSRYSNPSNDMSAAHVDIKSAAVAGAVSRGRGGELQAGQLDPTKYHRLDAKRTQIPAYSQLGEPSKEELAQRMTVVNVEEVAEDIQDADGNVIDTIYHQQVQVFRPDDPENPWNHSKKPPQGKAMMTDQPPPEQPEGLERLRQLEENLAQAQALLDLHPRSPAPTSPPPPVEAPPANKQLRIQVTRGDQPQSSTPPPAMDRSTPETQPIPDERPSNAPEAASQTLLLELVRQLTTLTTEVASIKRASSPIQPGSPPKSVTSPTPPRTTSEPSPDVESGTPSPANPSDSAPGTSSTSPSNSPPSSPSSGRARGLPVPKLRLTWETPLGQTQCPAIQVVIHRRGDEELVVIAYDRLQDTSFVPGPTEDPLLLTIDNGERREQMYVRSFGLDFDIPLDPGNNEGRVWKLVLLKRVE